MRNFEFDKDRADTSAVADVRPNPESPVERVRLDEREAMRQDALAAFHNSPDEGDSENNSTARIAGAVIVGLLLVGGSIYAYESTNHAPQTVAMLPQQHNAVAEQTVAPPATTPDASSAPAASSTPPAISTPRPVRSTRSILTAAKPVPETQASTSAPAPATSASADPAINQPMTPTPETAPPPQQSAMQQPITAPNVSGSPTQPAPEVANNASGTATVQPDLTPAQSSPATPAAPPVAPAQ